MKEIDLNESRGLVVLAWRSGEDGLYLKARGQGEEIRLRCLCGRCHWIVRDQFVPEGARLVVSCHSCGRRMTYVLEGVGLPAP